MDWVGMMPGKRGSRRLLGDYLLNSTTECRPVFPMPSPSAAGL